MKNIAAIALFIAASFVASSAPAQDHMVKATVPFNFTVGERTLPPGTYTLGTPSDAADLLAIRNRDQKVNILSMGMPNQDNGGRDNTLVFHKYGNQYYLSEIRSHAASIDLRFPMSKAEKRARAHVEEAGLFVNDPVLIALN
jgi:hypothetical protein